MTPINYNVPVVRILRQHSFKFVTPNVAQNLYVHSTKVYITIVWLCNTLQTLSSNLLFVLQTSRRKVHHAIHLEITKNQQTKLNLCARMGHLPFSLHTICIHVANFHQLYNTIEKPHRSGFFHTHSSHRCSYALTTRFCYILMLAHDARLDYLEEEEDRWRILMDSSLTHFCAEILRDAL